MFDDRWWKLTEGQLADMLEHGSDVVYVPALFDCREVFRRPRQLLIVDEPRPGAYTFEWSRVTRCTTSGSTATAPSTPGSATTGATG
jgi:hypothetical protein